MSVLWHVWLHNVLIVFITRNAKQYKTEHRWCFAYAFGLGLWSKSDGVHFLGLPLRFQRIGKRMRPGRNIAEISQASAHSFKRFTSRLLKLSFSLYAPITSDELISFERCQSSCEEHGTSEHYKKILSTVGFEPPTSQGLRISSPPISPLGHQSLDIRLNKCPWNLLSINKIEKVVCISHQQCVSFSLITYEYC